MSELNFTQPSLQTTKRFSNREAETDWSAEITTQSGDVILIAPAQPDDRAALKRFFEGVSRRDLYFRFLSGMHKVDEHRLAEMVDDTNDQTIDFLAFDPTTGDVLASAMLGADDSFESAEFAVCTRADMKGLGISWAMLDHAVRYAEAMGVKRIISMESGEQRDALRLEREMGFAIRPCPDDRSLLIAEKVFRGGSYGGFRIGRDARHS